MKAINNYLVVDKIKTEQKKIAGLIMTEDLDEDNRYVKAVVKSAGNLVEGVSDGSVVYYDKHAGHGIHFEDKLYFVIRISDIVLVD
jgi:co-chaperonin GroES (HSP10)|tara:strand:- start:1014 stop:1271 length:258 start_codon:yes stop_codon:yes gene_type:complete